MRVLFRPLLLSACVLALTAAAPETFTLEELQALEAERQTAEQKLAALESAGDLTETDTRKLESELLSAAMESQRREQQAATSEKRLIELRARLNEARSDMIQDEEALEDVLAALASTSRRKPPALIVSPDKANDAVRRAILMSNTAPRLSARAAALSDEIEELNTLERAIHRENARLDTAEATLALKTAEIERLAAAKRAQFEDLSGEASLLRRRAEELGAEATNLRDLLAALEKAAPSVPGAKPKLRPRQVSDKTPPKKPLSTPTTRPAETVSQTLKPLGAKALGGLGKPVNGNLVYAFGDKLPTGGKSEWLTIRARSGAQVLAPVSGRVEYAKPFRSYGQMLILRTSDGYNVILTGMSRIYATEGQTVKAGEPVGQMAKRDDPELNVELRKGDKVLNPARWMKGGR